MAKICSEIENGLLIATVTGNLKMQTNTDKEEI